MGKKIILIIDDEKYTRESCKTILDIYENLETTEAVNGSKGYELAKLEKPDLILLDNRMSMISGEQTAKMFRADPSLRSIPIIMITAMRMSEDEVKLIKLDVNSFIEKPFSPWQLIKEIEKYLGPLTEKL